LGRLYEVKRPFFILDAFAKQSVPIYLERLCEAKRSYFFGTALRSKTSIFYFGRICEAKRPYLFGVALRSNTSLGICLVCLAVVVSFCMSYNCHGEFL